MTEEESTTLTTIHVPLPRGHSAELRDPWDVTDAQRRPLVSGISAARRKYQRSASKKAPVAGDVTPQPGESVVDEAEDITDDDAAWALVLGNRERVWQFLIVSWSGPQLDGQSITATSIERLPIPILNALTKAVDAALNEVLGVEEDEGPTTP